MISRVERHGTVALVRYTLHNGRGALVDGVGVWRVGVHKGDVVHIDDSTSDPHRGSRVQVAVGGGVLKKALLALAEPDDVASRGLYQHR